MLSAAEEGRDGYISVAEYWQHGEGKSRLVRHQSVLPIFNSSVLRCWHIAFSLKHVMVLPLKDTLTGAAFASDSEIL